MIRLFKVYYPLRTLVLFAAEALIVWFSFVLGTMLRSQDSWLLLNVDGRISQNSRCHGLCPAAVSLVRPVRLLQLGQELGAESTNSVGHGICVARPFRSGFSVSRFYAGR